MCIRDRRSSPGPVTATAEKMERDGHTILKLNTGNPAVFGFEAPDVIAT